MVYAGTSWEGPKWRASVAPRATIFDRLKSLPRAVLVAMAAVLVTLSLALAAPAVQAHYFSGPSCWSYAYYPKSYYGYPYARGEQSCSYGGWRHYSEVDLYFQWRYWPDDLVDWSSANTENAYQWLTTSGWYYPEYGCYYSYHWVDNHDDSSSVCTWFFR